MVSGVPAALARYRGRRVLVTGHTGFKGSWLTAWLLELGAHVTGLALPPPTTPSLFETLGLASRIDHRTGDVRDERLVAATIDAVRPEVVFHLAAQALVRASYAEPQPTFATNVMGTVNVLEALRRAGAPAAVIVVTTDKCYENRGVPHAYGEDEPLGGHDPYSASKAAAELVVSAYRRSFFPVEDYARHGVALASVRAGNVIGGGDFATDRIVPDIMRALFEARPVRLRNPAAVRPWQHVLDALAGYLALGSRMLAHGAAGHAEAFNFGPASGDVLDVRTLTERVLGRWGSGRWDFAGDPNAPHEAHFLSLDSGKAVARLGWRPAYDATAAVEATTDWYRRLHEGDDMRAFTTRQIEQYVVRARAAEIGWATEA